MGRKKTISTRLDEANILGLLGQKPRSARALLKELLLPRGRRVELTKLLRGLADQGKVVRLRGGAFGLPKAVKTLLGSIAQTQAHFAFFIPQDQQEEDLYVRAAALKDAMPGDEVEVRVVSEQRRGQRRRQAEVVRVVKRAHARIVGRFVTDRGGRQILPDGAAGIKEFTVPAGKALGAKTDDKVVAQITAWPGPDHPGSAEIVEILGPDDDPRVGITGIIRRHGLPENHSSRAMQEAENAARMPGETERAGRLDLRDKPIVTIDGADARDFDDAVWCEDLPAGGWRLSVHIADVAHYVKTGTPLDLEARERGTSVYLPDRVLHMLPEPLSCGVCSLKPGEDRLALSAFMNISAQGKIMATEFRRTVIHSHGRLTYENVEQVLQGHPGGGPEDGFVPELLRLHAVAKALRKQRQARGSLDFDLPDPKVVLGPDGLVQTIEKRPQLDSHKLIEDCMIAANEAVARYLRRHDRPTLYRVHEPPSGEKLLDFTEFIGHFGYTFTPGDPKEVSKLFQRLLKSWDKKPETAVLNMALLRAMKLAVYSPKNVGHFGLASECYTHFTSPIRRYPDLIVHRMLAAQWDQGGPGPQRHELAARMVEWGEQLSAAERRAERAEREAVRLKQLEFISSRIGEEFAGRISSVTNFGFFVELADHYVEGLVPMSELLDDYYFFDDST
ncbi:ribonuclease R, partial [candidate division FCPU426 bacterium]|nr:ribonuclease R [candidate division FCPU426 bacterium]